MPISGKISNGANIAVCTPARQAIWRTLIARLTACTIIACVWAPANAQTLSVQPARLAIGNIVPLGHRTVAREQTWAEARKAADFDAETHDIAASLAGALFIALQPHQKKIKPISRGDHWRALWHLNKNQDPEIKIEPSNLFIRDVLRHVKAQFLFQGHYLEDERSITIGGELRAVVDGMPGTAVFKVDSASLPKGSEDMLDGVSEIARNIVEAYSRTALAGSNSKEFERERFQRIFLDCLYTDDAKRVGMTERLWYLAGEDLRERFDGDDSVLIINDRVSDEQCAKRGPKQAVYQWAEYAANYAKYAVSGEIEWHAGDGNVAYPLVIPTLNTRIHGSDDTVSLKLPAISGQGYSLAVFLSEFTDYLYLAIKGVFHTDLNQDGIPLGWAGLEARLKEISPPTRRKMLDAAREMLRAGDSDKAALLFQHIALTRHEYADEPNLRAPAMFELAKLADEDKDFLRAERYLIETRRVIDETDRPAELIKERFFAAKKLANIYHTRNRRAEALPLFKELAYSRILDDAVNRESAGEKIDAETWGSEGPREYVKLLMGFFAQQRTGSTEQRAGVAEAFHRVLELAERDGSTALQRRDYAEALVEDARSQAFFGKYDAALTLTNEAIDVQRKLPPEIRATSPYKYRVHTAFRQLEKNREAPAAKWKNLAADRATLIAALEEYLQHLARVDDDAVGYVSPAQREAFGRLDFVEALLIDEQWRQARSELKKLQTLLEREKNLVTLTALAHLYDAFISIGESSGENYQTIANTFYRSLPEENILQSRWNFSHVQYFFSERSWRANVNGYDSKFVDGLIESFKSKLRS